jgi:mediator of RNA polymerase II transcription subunit 5
MQLHSRLDMIQKHFNLFRTEAPKDANQVMQSSEAVPDALQFEANIVDGPNMHARASLYIYLNAAVGVSRFILFHIANLVNQLCGRPMLDDSSLISYLSVRYAVSISVAHCIIVIW